MPNDIFVVHEADKTTKRVAFLALILTIANIWMFRKYVNHTEAKLEELTEGRKGE